MFHKILFPTDFSKHSNHALLHAVRQFDFTKGEIIVQHVVSDYFKHYPQWTTMLDVNDLQTHMDVFVHNEMETFLMPSPDGVTLRRVLSKGKPAEEICALAEKELVDLVVMGAATAVITNKVIRSTTRPVLAIPAVPDQHSAGETIGRPRRILVASDFSEHSVKVARYAFELPGAADASIYLLHVIETSRAIDFALGQSHYTNAMPKMKELALNQLTNLIPDPFLGSPRVERIVESGAPSERIAAVADRVHADLVIVGTHEHGAAHLFLLGTTTDRLLKATSKPVLTVRL